MQLAVRERLEAGRSRVRSREQTRPVVVIADSGERAEVVLLPSGTVLRVGQDLLHQGAAWRVVAWRPSARAWIARPRRTTKTPRHQG